MGIRFGEMFVGDTWSFVATTPDYLAPEWTLTLYLTPRFTTPVQGQITLTSAPDATDPGAHRFAVAASVTAAYAPGMYSYYTRAAAGVEQYVIDATDFSGELEVHPDPSTLAQGHDGRSAARRAYDNAVAAFHNAQERAVNAGTNRIAVEYQIGERRMRFDSAQEAVAGLIATVDRLRIEVYREARLEAIRRGLADPSKQYVRVYRA